MDVVNKFFVFKSLLTMPSNVLPLRLKQTFPLIILIFTEGEGDGIESRLSFKIFSTLIFSLFFLFSDQRHGNSTVFDHPIIGFDDPQNGRNNNKPLEKETNLSTQEQKGPVSSNSEISSSSSKSSNSNNQKSKQEEQTKLTQKVPHAPQQFHKRLEIT